jgi:sporulation protein YlmC with PRC-barrel domain
MDVRLQSMTARKVYDSDGKVAGRIGEVIAERVGADCHVTEYLLGPDAYLSRLGITASRLFGLRRRRGPLRVPWHQLDLSDPEKLRLRCKVSDLEAR